MGQEVCWCVQRTSSSTRTRTMRRCVCTCVLVQGLRLAPGTATPHVACFLHTPILTSICCLLHMLARASHHACCTRMTAQVRAVIPRRYNLPGDRGVLIVSYAAHKKKAYSFFLVQVGGKVAQRLLQPQQQQQQRCQWEAEQAGGQCMSIIVPATCCLWPDCAPLQCSAGGGCSHEY